ncbi:MAG: histidine kinase [Myxococcales bacterium]|nr:histidine kinase [Myxococcales bacterium]
MVGNWTFGRKLGSAFAVTVVALIAIAVTGYRSTKSLIANDERVAHTHQVRRQIAELLSSVVNAETGQRGFVITAKDEFLEPYNAALLAIDRTFAGVRGLTLDNEQQTRRLDSMRPVIDAKLAELKRTIDQRRAAGFEATATVVASGEGKLTMDRIRSIINEMDQDEAALLETRGREAAASTEITTQVIVWGGLAAIIVTILVGWLITSSLAKQISSAVRHVQSSSTELQSAANQQASGAREQSTAMVEISTTISELLATSRQIAESAQRVSQIAAQTAGSARTGDLTVAKGSEAIASVRRQVDLIVERMLELGTKSQQVGAVLDIVAELAEQTNILAINATIEAAGAGDAGRRFGVVADEIRKLADRVAVSTKAIRGMVDDVRGAVNTTVMATEAGSKAVDVGGTQVAEMATAFRQITSLVGTTTDAAREIELSTKQQSTAVEQVNIAIANVAQATRETETSATQTLQTAAQLISLSTNLLKLVQTTGAG